MKYLIGLAFLILALSVSYFLVVVYPATNATTPQINSQERSRVLSQCTEASRTRLNEYLDSLPPFSQLPDAHVFMTNSTRNCMNQFGYDY